MARGGASSYSAGTADERPQPPWRTRMQTVRLAALALALAATFAHADGVRT